MNQFEHFNDQIQPVPKKTKKPLRVSLGVLVMAILLTGVFVFMATFVPYTLYTEQAVNEAYARFSKFDKLIEIAELYDEQYLYEVDPDMLDEALAEAYVYYGGDQYSYYYTAEEWQAELAESSGNSVGIGVYVVLAESGNLEVVQVMSESPAQKAGLQAGDMITAVDGVSVISIGYEEAINRVRGESGTNVTLAVIRAGETLSITVERNTYTPETVFAEVVHMNGKTLGYVHITEFMSIPTTANQFADAVSSLLEYAVDGLIFDVRNNGGGDLGAVVTMLDYLLPEGPIVTLYNADDEEMSSYSSDAYSLTDLPMVVLVNGNTASAAELFTSALQDYDKAEIVGTLTYGKGCGQQGQILSDGSVVFITTFYYDPPYSENYDRIGITPDYEVELAEKWQDKNVFLIPHEEDAQLEKAISVLLEKLQ